MDGTSSTLHSFLSAHLSNGSVLAIGAAFLFGVFVGFTPCVYPVLPITMSYIGSIAKGRKLNGLLYSLVYVLGMATVYSIVGVTTAIVSRSAPHLIGNGWVLLAVANFFILLALWQLHVFTLPVPQFIRGRERRGSALGAFSVGAASGLIVGPCTLPGLAAMVAFIASSAQSGRVGAVLFGAAAMFAYSLGMGVLLIIGGTFSGFLASLPKSGRWLTTIERIFAVLMILTAEFLLIYLGQNADFPSLSSIFTLGQD